MAKYGQDFAFTAEGTEPEPESWFAKSGLLMLVDYITRSFAFPDRLAKLQSVIFIFFVLVTCPAMGQDKQKRILAEEDYKLWHYMQTEKLSDDGEWISYRLDYENADTLFVRSIRNGKTFSFAGGTNGNFTKEHFIGQLPGNKLQVINLKKLRTTTYDHVSNYQTAGNYLLLHDKTGDRSALTIRKMDGVPVKVIDEVSEYNVSPNHHKVAIAVAKKGSFKVAVLALDDLSESTVAENNTAPYRSLSWSKSGQALAFFFMDGIKGAVFCYRKNTLSILDCTATACFINDKTIRSEQKPVFSDDEMKVFFGVQRIKTKKTGIENSVQVWNAMDRFIYPREQETDGFKRMPAQVLWNIETGKYVEINDTELPYGGPLLNGKYALTYNPKAYEPQSHYMGKINMYLTNLDKGERKLLLQEHEASDQYTMVSPGCNYIVYYTSPDWFIYDLQKDLHRNVTAGLATSFEGTKDKLLQPNEPYKFAGCTKGDQSVLVYDQYDIWEFFPDGKTPLRLTNGREQGIVFRIVSQNEVERSSLHNKVRTAAMFDLGKTVLFSAISDDYSKSGYYKYSKTNGLSKIAFLSSRTRDAIQNENRDITAFITESFNSPPEIFVSKKGKTSSVHKSNKQHHRFLWGNPEVIRYNDANGQPLSGILYYPAGFEKGKKYPMVVNIYERQHSLLHRYWMPSIYNGTGVNFANLMAQGYFVFLPDIVFNGKGVGMSAVECVEAGVKKVLESGNIDADKIGLIGHSFGGYETNFIISHSKLFKCAVAGAAVTDLTSANHALHRSFLVPNFLIIEHGQFRADGSIAERKDYFIENSPIYHAGNINTPLLSWSGLEDTQVESRQSVELYMAMRRLGKQHIMLLYPNEIHEILERKNTEDLTRKVESWFGYHLKDKPIEAWMIPN